MQLAREPNRLCECFEESQEGAKVDEFSTPLRPFYLRTKEFPVLNTCNNEGIGV
jgi:hypothetical protein